MPPQPPPGGCPASGQEVPEGRGSPPHGRGRLREGGDQEEGSPWAPRASSCIAPPASFLTGAPRRLLREPPGQGQGRKAEAGPAAAPSALPPRPHAELGSRPGRSPAQWGLRGGSRPQSCSMPRASPQPATPGHSQGLGQGQPGKALLFVRTLGTWPLSSQPGWSLCPLH